MFIQNVSAYADEDEVISSEESDGDAANDETSETTEADETNQDSEEYEERSIDESPSGSEEGEFISEILPTEKTRADVISIDLPTVNEEGDSPFDFIVDPQFLIYDTEAALYGGGKVEEGATLLFHNHEGEYDFSGQSDLLTIKNRSNVPVSVIISASISDLGEVGLSESADFGDSEACDLYLALVDDEGNEIPLRADEEVKIELDMDQAPENTYTFSYDEESETLQYTLSNDPGMIEFDTYSFGLKGSCNVNADWQDVSVHPSLSITWSVEPILSETEEIKREETYEIIVSDEANTDAEETGLEEETELKEDKEAEEDIDEVDNSTESYVVIENETEDVADSSESDSSNEEPEAENDTESEENTELSETSSETTLIEENNIIE